MTDVRWTQVSDDSSWHIIESSYVTDNGTAMVATLCGPPGGPQAWNQTSLDVLPGGSERSCENCLKIFARQMDQPALSTATNATEATEPPAPKKRGGRPRKNK